MSSDHLRLIDRLTVLAPTRSIDKVANDLADLGFVTKDRDIGNVATRLTEEYSLPRDAVTAILALAPALRRGALARLLDDIGVTVSALRK